uniref:uncharacterized protein LOC120335754 n=1 Tax=Styela clava TaxID=7725 RepID=UPI0019397A04|nr:uncharacterized protein LOC120335754 [Styela clava]
MRNSVIFICFLCSAFLVVPGSCYFSKFLNRMQKNWMQSWERMRDQNLRPRLVAELHLEGSPTFVQMVEGPRNEVELAVNMHNLTTNEVSLLRIRDVTPWLRHEKPAKISTVGKNIGWPNSVGKVEGSIMPGSTEDIWWASTVFYLPQEEEGRLVFLPLNGTVTELPTGTEITHNPIHISSGTNGKNWYYSGVKWMDMNQDGWPDIVTSRSRGMPGSIKISELVWFEHPGYRYLVSSVRGNWRSHPITHGPDVAFEVLRIPLPSGESRQVLIGAGYWDNKLYVVWTDDPEEDWTDPEQVKERVIDNHGWFFDLQLADINADGRDDILVSTWSHGSKQGSVIAYEIPCDFIRDEWRKHILIDGGLASDLPDLGSGGKINAFHPVIRHGSLDRKKKPFIMVSGDDDGQVYVLVPDSPKTNDWKYTKHTIYKSRGAVGAISIEDLNHDGFNEIVVPVVASNKLMIFTYEPAEIGPEYFVDETRKMGSIPVDTDFNF